MFLHLGADTVIPLADVIAITDLKTVRSGINRSFLNTMREKNLIIDVSSDNPKSFIITKKNVYLSAISSLTLKKRAVHLYEYGDEDE